MKLNEVNIMMVQFDNEVGKLARQNLQLPLPTANGRITITDNTLKITAQENHIEKNIENEQEFLKFLKVYFNLA